MGHYCGHSTDCLVQIYASSNSASLDVQETSLQQELGSTALGKGTGCENNKKSFCETLKVGFIIVQRSFDLTG